MERKRIDSIDRLVRWLIAIALAWLAQSPAFAEEAAMAAHADAMAPMSMADCQPCAACYMAPAPALNKLGNGDRPDIGSVSHLVPVAQIANATKWAAVFLEAPSLPLRVRYCRWLN